MSAEYSTAILNVIAGLGMFLYGMKLMGDGLQKVAGDKMRGILETLTKTRFSALIVGIIFTGIIQSSNAATVMVVSFVNAGLMNLSQAIGVIFGANIGTTVTAFVAGYVQVRSGDPACRCHHGHVYAAPDGQEVR